jgi:hypothetical protein
MLAMAQGSLDFAGPAAKLPQRWRSTKRTRANLELFLGRDRPAKMGIFAGLFFFKLPQIVRTLPMRGARSKGGR